MCNILNFLLVVIHFWMSPWSSLLPHPLPPLWFSWNMMSYLINIFIFLFLSGGRFSLTMTVDIVLILIVPLWCLFYVLKYFLPSFKFCLDSRRTIEVRPPCYWLIFFNVNYVLYCLQCRFIFCYCFPNFPEAFLYDLYHI